MRKKVFMPLMGTTICALVGCGSSEPSQVEYLAYFCDSKTAKCQDPDIYRFKVRKYENKVLLSEYDLKGKPTDNEFLKDCEILNKDNWRCVNLSMVDGELINNNNNPLGGFYWRYEKRVR